MAPDTNEAYEDLLSELSALCGIAPEYWDVFGNRHVTSADTRKTILRAMGVAVDSVDDLRRELNSRSTRPWRTVVDPVQVIPAGAAPVPLSVHLPVPRGAEQDITIQWSVADEQGRTARFSRQAKELPAAEEQWIDGTRYARFELTEGMPRELGYYDVTVRAVRGSRETAAHSRIIVAPDRCYLPPAVERGRTWGLTVNLYALRSRRNWGIGDFTDLGRTLEWVCTLGGSFVGINPLHATPNTLPYGISPYSPISRLFRNFIYLDVETVPDVKASKAAQDLLADEAFQEELARLRESDLVRYDLVAALKERVLRLGFEHFLAQEWKRTNRGREFEQFCTDGGSALEGYALYMALRRHLEESRGVYSWQEWPEEYRRPENEAVQAFRRERERDVLFFVYLQWLIDTQLNQVTEGPRSCEMVIGLYQDLAIGAVAGGSDVWTYQDVIAPGIDVGAPPDDFNPLGQNWGFPPAVPAKLREQGYDLFIRTLRNAMRQSGALRIDHALGLFRLFWIPRGRPASEGAYVASPAQELLRIIALESVRNRCAVVAEDLGTVGPEVRDELRRFGMLSMRLLYFERNYPDPSFLSPERYPELAACAVTTHDLPTIHGYWECRDIDLKERLGICRDAGAQDAQRRDRERDKALLADAMQAQGITPPGLQSAAEGGTELPLPIYHYLAKTPCKIVVVSLDDVIGTLNQQNMPGTVAEYPNWQQKAPLSLEAIMTDERFTRLADIFRFEGRSLTP